VVRSTTDNWKLEPTTPSAPTKVASRHFVTGRSHPSALPRRGVARLTTCATAPEARDEYLTRDVSRLGVGSVLL
jgi:hypothetical protein